MSPQRKGLVSDPECKLFWLPAGCTSAQSRAKLLEGLWDDDYCIKTSRFYFHMGSKWLMREHLSPGDAPGTSLRSAMPPW